VVVAAGSGEAVRVIAVAGLVLGECGRHLIESGDAEINPGK